MEICPDPLEGVRYVGSDQPACASLPADYPTIAPHTLHNVEYKGRKATAFNFNVNNYDRTNIIDSSLCVNSKLIQRLQHKIDLYQTPSSNDTRQILQLLTNIVKQHVPSFVFNDIVADDGREQISQLQPKLRQTISNILTTNSHQDNSPMALSTPNISDHHLESDRITSAIDLKNSSLLSPSHNQQGANRKSSSKQITSILQSPTSSISDYEEQVPPIPSPSVKSHSDNQIQHTIPTFDENTDRNGRKDDHQHLSHKAMRDSQIKKPNNWIEKLTKKFSSKRLNAKSVHDLSSQAISHMSINDQHRIKLDHIHMKEAMDALELDLTKEAFQALINKKKDSRQNGLMHLITAPARCCRSCRTQRRLAAAAQHSIEIAIKNMSTTLDK